MRKGCALGGLAIAFLTCSGCVHHPRWRLVNGGAGEVLIPPDVKAANLAQRRLTAKVAPGDTSCPAVTGPIHLKVRGKRARMTVVTSNLNRQPTGGLAAWASELEDTHCLAPGEGIKLAGRVAESVPLDPAAAFRLLNANDFQTGEVDLRPQTRLKVVSPLWREAGVGMIAGPMAVTGTDRHLTVTAKSADNLLGEETSVYAVRPKAAQAGSTITPLYADVQMQAQAGPATERRTQPAINYFKFPAAAAFYRLFYESTQTDFTALILAAPTPAELDRRTKILEANGAPASCEKLTGDMCIAIPKDVAVNPMISVTVNGVEVLEGRGARLAGVIVAAGQRQPGNVLRTLTISKPWNGRLIPVVFDPADGAILTMALSGGEIISWH